jgi:LemA protein
MKAWHIIVGILVIIVILAIALVSWGIRVNNTIIAKEQAVEESWGNVQSSYQRRADLIPNLVETVKGYAKHEREVFSEVTEARAKATSLNINLGELTAERLTQLQQAQQALSAGIGRLLAIAENYPQLRASENFKDLQVQLEGTENRINVARNRYNASCKDYNTYIKLFFQRIIASMRGSQPKPYFEAEAGAEVAPEVRF